MRAAKKRQFSLCGIVGRRDGARQRPFDPRREGRRRPRATSSTPSSSASASSPPPAPRATDNDFGTAVHEYAHRLQAATPALDYPFRDLHKARKFKRYAHAKGKPDRYIDECFGLDGKQRLRDLLRDDPGPVDLATGVLMRYNP